MECDWSFIIGMLVGGGLVLLGIISVDLGK